MCDNIEERKMTGYQQTFGPVVIEWDDEPGKLVAKCQSGRFDCKGRKWDTVAGRKWIEQMDSKALEWEDRNLGLVLQIIDANPATPTGHEKEGENRG
jgi:hypothetical protein